MSYLEDHYNEIFKKYSTEELLEDIRNYQLGGGKLTKVLNHFFEEEMFKKRTTTIKVTLDGMDFLMFMANQDQIDDFTFSGPKLINIVATLSTNTWNNVTTKQGKIKNYSLDKVEEVDGTNENWEDDF